MTDVARPNDPKAPGEMTPGFDPDSIEIPDQSPADAEPDDLDGLLPEPVRQMDEPVRQTGSGNDSLSQMQHVLANVAEGSQATTARLARFANTHSREVGRSDLAPGFDSLNEALQGIARQGRLCAMTAAT